MKSAHCVDHLNKKAGPKKGASINTNDTCQLIQSVCYRYKRESKQMFFKNKVLNYLFLKALPALREKFNKKSINL